VLHPGDDALLPEFHVGVEQPGDAEARVPAAEEPFACLRAPHVADLRRLIVTGAVVLPSGRHEHLIRRLSLSPRIDGLRAVHEQVIATRPRRLADEERARLLIE
jgi:hypothetical protein